MIRFVTRPNSFNEVRNKFLLWSVLIFSVLLIVEFFWFFSDTDAVAYYILFAFQAALTALVIFNNLRRQKKIHESFVLTVDSESLLREQHGTESIRIMRSEIRSIVRASNGAILITGASRMNPILIPAQVDDRENLETILNAIRPIEHKSSKRGVIMLLASMVGLFVLGWLFFGVDNRFISGAAGILLLTALTVSFVLTVRSKNIENRLRRMSFLGIIPVLSIAAILYFKIFLPEQNKVPLKSSYFFSSMTIYFLDDNQYLQRDEFIKLVKDKLPAFTFAEQFPDTITHDFFIIDAPENIQTDYESGDEEYLSGAGVDLTPTEITRLQSVQKGLYIQFVGANDSAQARQLQIASFIDNLASENSLIILDENTRSYFNSASWRQYRVKELNISPTNLSSQITIHTYREGELCRAVTLGMDKFSLPDISIKNFPCSDQRTMGKLINAIAQTMFENPWITSDSVLIVDIDQLENDSARYYLRVSDHQVKPVAKVKLKSITPEDGDAINYQLTVDFSVMSDGSQQEAQIGLLKTLFGRRDSLIYTTHDDAVLLEASKRARERLPELKQLFNRGLEPGYSMLVKAPFGTDDGGREWMWVEVSAWQNKDIKGLLQSQPYNVSGLVAGAEVKVNEDDIFDYILYKPDGSFEGNETEQYLH